MKNTDKLKQLLVEHERLDGEKQRHEKLGAELLNEENQLMRTADIEDPAELEAVNQVRLKREMVPNKIKAFGDATEKVLAELAEESARRLADHRAAVLTRIEALKDKVAKTLEPYFAPETNSPNLAALILHEHDTGLISAKRAAGRIADNRWRGNFCLIKATRCETGIFWACRRRCRRSGCSA
jgi:hypothetical protein